MANRKKSTAQGSQPTPITVEGYLKGVHYPTKKEDLLQLARQNNAPQNIMDTLNKLDRKDFKSPIDVSKEVSKVR
jgi:hypothetical protein